MYSSVRCRQSLVAVLALALLSACASQDLLRDPLPDRLTDQATIGDYKNIRFYADDEASLRMVAEERIRAVTALHGGKSLKGQKIDIVYLSISGGGGDGAFGAGLLNGWTASGSRPQFNVVTGISTGAMIAPLAFLGPRYDAKLKEAYTTISTKDIAQKQVLAAVFGQAEGLSSTGPLQNLIAKYMTASMLAEIAAESRAGRMLLIGTTNLDAQRPVIWDIGAIAVSGRPDALELTRRIILASASIPGAFPPVKIKVTADGKTYDEMHVDGGVTRQVFLYPPGYDPREVDRALGWKATRKAYIIRNSKIDPEFKATEAKLMPIAARSISTLIKTQGIGDLYRIYEISRRDHVDYNVAYIPGDFTMISKSAFDKPYMNALYNLGFQLGNAGYRWQKVPPGMSPQ